MDFDDRGVRNVHERLRRKVGYPPKCSHCEIEGKHIGTKIKRWSIEWANIDHKYSDDPKDYIGLCQSCHLHYDGRYIRYWKGKKMPLWIREKFSKAHPKVDPSKWKPVDQLDRSDNLINTYLSLKEASAKTGTNYKSISRVANSETGTANGFKWRFSNVR